jgi:hypothetical protein
MKLLTGFTPKALCGLWPRHDLAQKLGQKLGQRVVLQRALPGRQAQSPPSLTRPP